MKFKSTDVILNSIYEEYSGSKYDILYISGILIGALIYSYAIDNIPHSEFRELLELIRSSLNEREENKWTQ